MMKIKFCTGDGKGFVCNSSEIEQFYPLDLTHTILEFNGGSKKVVVNNDMRQVASSIFHHWRLIND